MLSLVAVVLASSGKVEAWLGQGNGGIEPAGQETIAGPGGLTLADMNADGFEDLVVATLADCWR